MTDYLPDSTETRCGLTLMEDEFTTYATANVMVDNITYSDAEKLCDELSAISGVKKIAFDSGNSHYIIAQVSGLNCPKLYEQHKKNTFTVENIKN